MDSLILSMVAFSLGSRQDKLLPEDFQVEEKGTRVKGGWKKQWGGRGRHRLDEVI